MSNQLSPSDTTEPSEAAMRAAVDLEIQMCLQTVTTRGLALHLDKIARSLGHAQSPGIDPAVFTRRIELARKFIAREYNDPAQELRGDWIDPVANPAHDALCLCLQDLSSVSSTVRDGADEPQGGQ